MANSQPLVIVSNRLPTSVARSDNGKLVFNTSNGGLATAMSSLESTNRIWIGWPGIASDDITEQERQQISTELAKQGCIPVFLTAEQIELFYEGYANDTLWPMFHYFQSYVQYNEEYWDAYQEVNRLYAAAVAEHSEPDAQIWVHDYQLLLTPAMIRQDSPDVTIGFFLHIPFPSYEIFRQLPNRREIIEGMLGADLIGFHIYDYARHFLSSVKHITGDKDTRGVIHHNNRAITIDNFPIGIDYSRFTKLVGSKQVRKEIESIREHYLDQKIIISVDRLDYSKGILQRLEAFELYLAENPSQHKKIALVIVAVPSRTSVETYQVLREEIELAISRINGTYAALDWTPISYQFKNLPMERVVALYNMADVAMVTPLRDGMNLVAKEFIASQTDDPGVLILSEMAGAIDELPEAISINPNSIRNMSESLGDALTMPPAERQKRIATMQVRIKNYSVQHWAQDFIEQLAKTKSSVSEQNYSLDERSIEMLVQGYRQAESSLLLVDYDGTLKPLVDSPDPEAAKPSKLVLKLLSSLSAQPNTRVVVISGRSKQAMDDWFSSIDDLTLVAEHGAWIKNSNADWTEQRTSFEDYRQRILQILKKYSLRTPGSVIEEKSHSIVWHYRNVQSELAYSRNENIMNELARELEDTDIQAHHGKKIIEIKPNSVDKGRVAHELYANTQPDFTLCIGDDYTDEDMFKALPEEAITIKVGPGDSDALLRVSNVRDVQNLLSKLSE